MPAITSYNPNWLGHPVNNENIWDYTGNTRDQFIGVSGCYGFNEKFEDKDYKISGKYPHIDVEVNSSPLFLGRIVNIKKRTIKNNFFMLKKGSERRGIGCKVFKSQVERSIDAGLKQITVNAIGNFEELPKISGYIVWVKFGFVMNKESQIEFDELMQREKRPEEIVQDMYLNPEMDKLNRAEGREIGADFWKKKGSRFDGIFNLTDNSFSRQYFEKYCESKRRIL